jgi:hypothetical protein
VPASFTRVEPLKARITHTANGYPAELGEVRDGFGQSAMNAPDEGWFWIFATPGSAKRIRRDGHKVVGSLLTTWIPPQDSLEVLPVAEAARPVAPHVRRRRRNPRRDARPHPAVCLTNRPRSGRNARAAERRLSSF